MERVLPPQPVSSAQASVLQPRMVLALQWQPQELQALSVPRMLVLVSA